MTPEEKARHLIDAQLAASGWVVQTNDKINLSAARGVAVCELSFATGEPDYALFVDGSATASSTAPTGRNMPAQRSDAALGHGPKNASSPEGANQSGELRGGLGNLSAGALAKVEAHQLIGNDLNRFLDEINLSLVP